MLPQSLLDFKSEFAVSDVTELEIFSEINIDVIRTDIPMSDSLLGKVL